jgi:hypothetical protein
LTDIGGAGSVTGMTTPQTQQTAREMFDAKNTLSRMVPLSAVAIGDWVQDTKRGEDLSLLAEVLLIEERIAEHNGKPYIVLHIRRDWPDSSEHDEITGLPMTMIWCQKEVTDVPRTVLLTASSAEPDTSTVVKLRLSEGRQEIWESSAENVGGWCTTAHASRHLGNGYLSWSALTAYAASRGATIVLMTDADESSYRQGWAAGRQDLLSDVVSYVHDLANVA